MSPTIFESRAFEPQTPRSASVWLEAAKLTAAILIAPLAFVVGLVIHLARGRIASN